ncbi:MAG: SDR family oxidoreductase [Selenomonadaceae bacterium]|nr:SDR family oxidoreductase [Selenomonadaceae bacterium]
MSVTFDFTGKNFVVVGATSGIGKQAAIELVDGGANILAIGRNIERLDALKNINPQKISAKNLDVTCATAEDWVDALENFKNKFGKIDGGIYSAGIYGLTPLNSFDTELARKIFDTSFWGMVNFLQVATKKIFSNAKSSFVVMSSIAASYGSKGLFAYAAAKAAVQAAIKPFAKEIIKNGHRINSVAPAAVQTEMLENNFISEDFLSRQILGVATPADITGLILFLLSSRADLITGQNFFVDGGYIVGAYV